MNSFDPDPAFDAAFDKLASEMQRSETQAAQQNARAVQIGGDHYKKLAIQPFDYAMANNLNAGQTLVLRYITRYRDKNGIEDLRKARHVIDMLIERETANG